MDIENLKFNELSDVIDTIVKYKASRKRARDSDKMGVYNKDLEMLSYCLEPLKKLNNLIGMEDIKKNLVDQILFYAQGLNTDEMMHTCLTGPPGVGKTTVGKILAELYCNLGYLKTNNFRVVGRSDLVAGYLGQTALKTKKVLKESLNGVLFIDEIYSLGGSDDYSKECIDTINQFLSEHTSNFIMIIAGYKEEVDRYFFNMNPGLRRRFPWIYEIGNYSMKNLKDIFIYQVKQNGWDFEETFDFKLLDDFFEAELFKNNGGDTLALFDKTKICHSRRVFGKRRKYKKSLNFVDIRSGMELLKSVKNKSLEKAPPFGMYT